MQGQLKFLAAHDTLSPKTSAFKLELFDARRGDASMNLAGFMVPRWLKSLSTGLRVASGSHCSLPGMSNCSSARDLSVYVWPRTFESFGSA